MDRRVWLAGRLAAVVASYDSAAAGYDEHEYPAGTQREWIARMLRLIRPGGTVWTGSAERAGTSRCWPRHAAAWFRREGPGIVDEGYQREDGWVTGISRCAQPGTPAGGPG
jgi:hypothetical protein